MNYGDPMIVYSMPGAGIVDHFDGAEDPRHMADWIPLRVARDLALHELEGLAATGEEDILLGLVQRLLLSDPGIDAATFGDRLIRGLAGSVSDAATCGDTVEFQTTDGLTCRVIPGSTWHEDDEPEDEPDYRDGHDRPEVDA